MDPKPGTSGTQKADHKRKGEHDGKGSRHRPSAAKPPPPQTNSKKHGRAPTKEQPGDNSLKLVLVDDDRDKGRVDQEIVTQMDLKILESLYAMEDDDVDFVIDSSWEQGRRVYTCRDEKSKVFAQQCFENLTFEGRCIRLLPYDERGKAGHPRGWIWVKLPHVPPETLMGLLHKLNKPMDIRGKWAILKTGKKRDYGQFFLLQIHRESIPMLIERKYEVRIGLGTSVIKLEGEVRLGQDEEPQQIISNNVNKGAAN